MIYSALLSLCGVFMVGMQQINGYTPEALADQITSLPGTEDLDVTFNQFSGYLTVNQTKHIHYWFVESANDPTHDPIALWTNGGPGCSGLIGFFTEHGPFRPNSDGKTLRLNEFSWNKVANMIYVEQPCGVGFSYADNDDELYTGDEEAAKDNYEMLQAFFTRFPEYRTNNLYFSSESYGGHYLPMLSKEVVDQNAVGHNPILNFKGFAVGNAYTTWESGFASVLAAYWGHQLVAKPTWDEYTAKCVNKKVPIIKDCLLLAEKLVLEKGDLNPYGLDFEVCNDYSPDGERAQVRAFYKHLLADSSILQKSVLGAEPFEPCADVFTISYLNDVKVKEALHVRKNIIWTECALEQYYKHSDGPRDMTGYYKYLIDGGYGLSIMVYSGDNDAVCSTQGTQSWIWDLGYQVSEGKMWRQWTVNDQVAGYSTIFGGANLGFVTVHGAGHMVPAYKPEFAYNMWVKYLKGDFTKA